MARLWHSDLIPALKGIPDSQPCPPDCSRFLASLMYLLPSRLTLRAASHRSRQHSTLYRRLHRGLVQPAVSPPEPTLRWVAWLSSDYGCGEASGGSCQEG